MRVVWHGAYAKYFEDAREYFGQQFDLGYLLIEQEGYFAPIVDLQFQYKQPLRYAMEPEITIGALCRCLWTKTISWYGIHPLSIRHGKNAGLLYNK